MRAGVWEGVGNGAGIQFGLTSMGGKREMDFALSLWAKKSVSMEWTLYCGLTFWILCRILWNRTKFALLGFLLSMGETYKSVRILTPSLT